MDQKDFDTWEELEAEILRMEAERQRANEKESGGYVSEFLFRGQSDASWRLDTTLDRRLGDKVRVLQYFRLVLSAKPQVETFTGRQWDSPDLEYSKLEAWARSYDEIRRAPPGYEFLVYLRHHGFPSPLLDWTRSPYVAAYFALAGAPAARVALYAYCEYAGGGGKVGSSDSPQIVTLGPYVKSHSRHYLQQSQYTMCCFFTDAPEQGLDRQWWFVPHERVFEFSDLLGYQDQVWKFTLPASERTKVLKRLDNYNLNAFSLFQSDESLLETIALREIELRDRRY